MMLLLQLSTNTGPEECRLAVRIDVVEEVAGERSQHANKRLARALLAHMLAALAQDAAVQSRAQRRIQHHQMERGNAGRVFKLKFFPKKSAFPQ